MKRSIFGFLDSDSSKRLKLSRDLAKHEEWTEAILPADVEAERPEGETSRRPLVIFALVVCAVVAVLVVRLFALQILYGSKNLAKANGNRVHERVARAPRGIIYDRNKNVLVRNQASYDVTVVPQLLPRDSRQRQAEFERVSGLIGIHTSDILAKIDASCGGKKDESCYANPVAALVASNITRDQALLFEQSSESLPGFALDVNPVREYLDGGLLSVFLGYTGRVNAEEAKEDSSYGPTDLIGKLGIEKQYEAVLRGVNGGEQTEVDATGRPVKVLASRDPVPGQNLVLSIDQGLQQKMVEALQKQITASGAKRGAAVALNPNTGEVLAAASLPSYDNNLFSRGISQADYQSLLNNPGQPLFNKVASGGYPSGSIIKPLGSAAILQEHIVNPSTVVNDTGKIVVPNPYDPAKPYTFYGWERQNGLGPVNVLTAIAKSSDIFFYKVMGGFTDFLNYLGVDKLSDYYKKFGLGSKTGIDLPSESKGRVPTRDWKKQFSGEDWYPGDTYNISVGQGDLLVSPLQMAVAVSAIANGGKVYKPHFVDQVLDTDGKLVREIAPEVVRQGFVSAENLAVVRKGMWMAVNESYGTACCRIRADVPVQVAAKTGTAETVVHESDDPTQSRAHAWFEAFAPYDNPQIVMVALVEHSGGEGALYAAPVVREALQWYFTQGAGMKFR